VQELKEQLLAERAWWQKTSAAQVTQQMEQLRHDLDSQQVTLAKIAEHLLAPNSLQVNIESTPQMKAVEASLGDLKVKMEQQQEAQELHANALREGLLEIQEQRVALRGLAKIKDLDPILEDGSSSARGGSKVALQTSKPDIDLQAWVTLELGKLRSEVAEARRSSQSRELTEPAASVEKGHGTKALELHARLAEELADVISRSEVQRVNLTQAIETERMARIGEVAQLRAALEESIAQKAAALDAFSRVQGLQDALAKEVVERRAECTNIRSKVEELGSHEEVGNSSKTAPVSARLEAHAVNSDIQPLTQVSAMIRDAQEMLRFEFSARLAEVEINLRESGLQLQAAQSHPKTDGDELAQRLEAIKSQLRSEIEKRVERSPTAKPLGSHMLTQRRPTSPSPPPGAQAGDAGTGPLLSFK
jgi:hypothetical protein